jgi:hypothetical protein
VGRLAYRRWEAKDGGKVAKHQVIGLVTFGERLDPGENEHTE